MTQDPFALDFAALRTLRLVFAHGSFSRAAETLGVTQSTISYTMSRLREVFSDPLFVRQGAGMVPTDRCNEIVAQAGELIDRFETLTAQRQFDPAEASVEIGLSCNFYERVTILPHVTRILRREAPGIKLKVISSSAQGKQQLLRSESDLLIGPIRIEDSGYYRRSLLREEYTCVMDPSNPLAQTPLTIERFVKAPQVVVNYGGSFRSRFLVVMEAAGHVPNTVMEVPSPANLPDILVQTDMIATVPSRIAQMFGDAVVSVPCPFPAELSIDLYWTARTHVSAPHMWLRSKIAEAASQIVD
ncbi:LysR family transcriptional regulator [Pseudophaeobacter sp.]|jgi:DNA-binding transcriptional LysR family regulator|uniref:LysR family transcriptional regulator n=1 Tax=Pseudophaeobacter sp. TaxID=1971739 RepID=UPI0025D15708|nr:LysR family transcriptional regulator [uncultured Pseudophaeobacter sp.]